MKKISLSLVFIFCLALKAEADVVWYSLLKDAGSSKRVAFYGDVHGMGKQAVESEQAQKAIEVFNNAKKLHSQTKFIVEAGDAASRSLHFKILEVLDKTNSSLKVTQKQKDDFLGILTEALCVLDGVYCFDKRPLLKEIFSLTILCALRENEVNDVTAFGRKKELVLKIDLTVKAFFGLLEQAFDRAIADAHAVLALIKNAENKALITNVALVFENYKAIIQESKANFKSIEDANWFAFISSEAQKASLHKLPLKERLPKIVGRLKEVAKYMQDSRPENEEYYKHYNWMVDISVLKQIFDQKAGAIFVGNGVGHQGALIKFLQQEGYEILFDTLVYADIMPPKIIPTYLFDFVNQAEEENIYRFVGGRRLVSVDDLGVLNELIA